MLRPKATSKQFQQLEAASKSPLYTIFSNTLGGLESVRAFQAQGHFRSQTDIAIDRSQVRQSEAVPGIQNPKHPKIHSKGPFYYRFSGLVGDIPLSSNDARLTQFGSGS